MGVRGTLGCDGCDDVHDTARGRAKGSLARGGRGTAVCPGLGSKGEVGVVKEGGRASGRVRK